MPNGQKKSYQQFLEEFRAPAAIAPSPAPPQYPTPQYPPQEPAKEGWWAWLTRHAPWNIVRIDIWRGMQAADLREKYQKEHPELKPGQVEQLPEFRKEWARIYQTEVGKLAPAPTPEETREFEKLPFRQRMVYEAPYWGMAIGVSGLVPSATSLQAQLASRAHQVGKGATMARAAIQVLRPIAATERLQARALNSIISKLRPFKPEQAFKATTQYKNFLRIKPTLPISEQTRVEAVLRAAFQADLLGQRQMANAYRLAIFKQHPGILPETATAIPAPFIKAFPGWEKAGGVVTITAERWATITPANQDILLKALGVAKPTPGTVGTAWAALPATVRAILAGVPEPEAPPLVKAPTPEEEAEEMTAPMLEEILGRKITTLEELAAARDEYRRRLRGEGEGIPTAPPEPPRPPVPGVPGMEVPEELPEEEVVRRVREIELATTQRLLVELGGLAEVPPYIREGREPTVGDLSELKFGRPTPLELLTSQEYYVKKLGAGPLMAPLEIAKAEQSVISKIMERIIAKKVAQLSKEVKPKMWELLNTYEAPPAELTGKDREAFIWFRSLTQSMWRAENQVRALLGEEQIEYHQAYIRNIAISSARGMIEWPEFLPASLANRKGWKTRIVSAKVWNPMEMERLEKELAEALGIVYSKDLKQSLTSMVRIGLKEIFLTQPAKMFKQNVKELGDALPAKTWEYLDTYMRVSIKGQQTDFDKQMERVFRNSGLAGVINQLLASLGKPPLTRPLAAISRIMGRLVISGALGPRPDILIRNLFQNIQNIGLAGVTPTLKSFLPADEATTRLIDKSLYFALYHGFEELPIEAQAKLERAWLWLYGKTAVFNARQGMKAAYHHYKPYFTNPKHKDLGYQSPRRTGREPKGFLYPEEEEFLLMLMEYDSGVAQYVYSVLGMPGIYRHKTAAAALRLQSWWMNYFAKYWGEMLHRLGTGEVGYGFGPMKMNPLEPGVTPGVPPEPPDGITIEMPPESDEWRPRPKAPWRDRLNILLYMMLGGGVLTAMGYTRSFMFGVLPGRFAPSANILMGVYGYAVAYNEQQREVALKQMWEGIQMHVPGHLAYEDFKKAFTGEQPWSKVFFYTQEGWPPGLPTWGLPPLEATETIRTSQAKLGIALPITEEERTAATAEGRAPVAEIYELADARRDINRDIGMWGLFTYPLARLGEEQTKLGELIRNANDWIGRYERIPAELRLDFRKQYTDEAATAEAYLFMFGKVSSLQSPKGEGYKSWAVIQDLIKEYNIPLEAIPNYTAEASKQRAITPEQPTIPPAPPYQPPTGELGYEDWLEELRR